MRQAVVAVGFAVSVLATGCGRGKPVVVGARVGTEQAILSEITAQQIERKTGLPVVRHTGFTSSSQTAEALAGGQVDLYVEYTGSAMLNALRLDPASDPAAVRERVRSAYRERLRVEMLDPLGFDARPALLTRTTGASNIHQLASLGDTRWRFGMTYDFLERPDGLRLLNRAYSIPIDGAARTFDPGLLGKALANGEVNLVAGSQSDAVLMEPGVVALDDDKQCFPPYEASILVRRETLDRSGELGAALRSLSGRLPLETIRRLNHDVEFKKRSPADAAREFLSRL